MDLLQVWMSNGNITEAGRPSAARTPWDPPSGGSAVVSVLDPGTPWLVRSPARGRSGPPSLKRQCTLPKVSRRIGVQSREGLERDRKSTRLNSSHLVISY